MSNNVKVLLVGAGYMAKEHSKVLKSMDIIPFVVGRGKESAESFENETECKVITGDIVDILSNISDKPTHAIVAVNVEQLRNVTLKLLSCGIKDILVEKPAGINRKEIEDIVEMAQVNKAKILVAYNRRFYSSVEKALQIIEDDGGVISFNFEFTEWSHKIDVQKKDTAVRNAWFLANSTHVVDLAFFLGGFPKEINSYVTGSLPWHPHGSIYCGSGVSKTGSLFSYHANWAAPGRWSVEILTNKHRLYLKPLEKLQIQDLGTVVVRNVEIEDEYDLNYKPGVYKMLNSFLNSINDERWVTIEEQLEHMDTYENIEGI